MNVSSLAVVLGSVLLLAGCDALQSGQGSISEVRGAINSRDYPKAAEMARKLAEGAPKDPAIQFELARAEALAGNNGSALDALNKAVSLGLADAVQAIRDPAFDSIRFDDRFVAIAQRLAPVGSPAAGGGQMQPTQGAESDAPSDGVSIKEGEKGTSITAGDVVLNTDF